MNLSSVSRPAGVELIGELEEIVVATVTAPSEVIEEPEVEEEAELVGAEAEAAAEEAPAEGEAEAGGEEAGGEAPAESS
jgi:hypothetical protein